jgi:hypothetical protein
MPKQSKHWMGLVWKKCPVSTALLALYKTETQKLFTLNRNHNFTKDR